jgi:hypothetical protein
MLVDHMLCAIDGARTTELAQLGSDVSRAYGNGHISEDDYQRLWEAIQERRTETPPRLSTTSKSAPRSPQRGTKSKLALGWPRRRPRRSPDREASRERARMLGGSSAMPPDVRCKYTEFERAALFIIAREVKHHGFCDLSVGQIAAEAGVCVRTVQNAEAEAVRQGDLAREVRERKGQKNDTNILRITSAEWLAWLTHGSIGCKVCTPTKSIERKKKAFEGRTGSGYRPYRRFGSEKGGAKVAAGPK